MQSKVYLSRKNYRRLLILNVFVCIVLFFAAQKFISGFQYKIPATAAMDESFIAASALASNGAFGYSEALPGNSIFFPVRGGSDAFNRLFLLFLFLSCIFMTMDTIARRDSGFSSRKFFMLILVPYLQLVFFASSIRSDIYALFLVTLFLYIVLRPYRNAIRIPVLIFISLLLYFVRSELLLFPLIITMIHYSLRNRNLPFTREAVMLVIYMLTILPVGISGWKSNRSYPTVQRTFGLVPVKPKGEVSKLAIRLFQYNHSVLCV